MSHWLEEGIVGIPVRFFREYASRGIDDQEMMLLLQLYVFQQVEKVEFPTFDQLSERLSCDRLEVMQRIKQLIDKGLLKIESRRDPATGVPQETYQLLPLYQAFFPTAEPQTAPAAPPSPDNKLTDLLSIFEQEMGRLLSPMECEMLGSWLDRDGLSEELIIAALKEAVLQNKLSMRYIDAILLDWQRNRIRTPQEAQEHAARFRQRKSQGSSPSFTFYNWLEEEEEGGR